MKKGRWLVVLGLLTGAFAGPASAQLYAGGSVGFSQSKDICDAVVASVTCDDDDTAWRAFGGYQFNQYFALELGFANLGESSGSGGGAFFTVEAKEAWDLSALFTIPVATRLSLLLRLGAHRTRVTVDDTGAQEADTGSAFTYGVGAEYALGKLGVRAEWQRYENAASGTIAESDIDVVSVGLLFRF